MRRTAALVVGLAIVIGVGVAAPAGARSGRANAANQHEQVTATCQGMSAPITVTLRGRGRGAAAHGADGRVYVVKGLAGTVTGTVTVATPTATVASFSHPVNEPVKGRGHRNLTSCTFSRTQSHTFTITAGDVRKLSRLATTAGGWNQYVGRTATITETLTGTVSVKVVGRRR
jgi:hypothetical protein